MTSMLYPEYSCADGPRQELVSAIAKRIPAALSVIGSGYIVAVVWVQWRKNKSSVDPYQRIMAMYSVNDILYSLFYWFMGSWMIPTETGWLGALGNTTTCSIQGFIAYAFGSGSVMYQMMLALQMMLLVTYKWTPRKFAEKIEYRMHWFILLFTTIAASVPLFFQGYNPQCGAVCTINPLPFKCGNWSGGDGTTDCVLGNPTVTDIYLYFLSFLVVVTTLFCTVAMIAIYRTVYNQEKRNARYSFAGNDEADHSQSKRIRKSMVLYTSSFYVCWIFPIAILAVPNTPRALRIFSQLLMPLMGFLNMLVFIQPKCVKYQKDNEGTGLMTAYSFVIFSAPIKTMKRLSTRLSVGEIDIPDDIDDGIDFRSDDECIDEAQGQYSSRVIVSLDQQIAEDARTFATVDESDVARDSFTLESPNNCQVSKTTDIELPSGRQTN